MACGNMRLPLISELHLSLQVGAREKLRHVGSVSWVPWLGQWEGGSVGAAPPLPNPLPEGEDKWERDKSLAALEPGLPRLEDDGSQRH
jgi:hypothetical protein